MTATLMGSADLLDRAYRLVRKPSNSVFPASTDWYAFFTEAENEIKLAISALVPNALMGAPTIMTTADSGLTYTFGNDQDGNPLFPIGAVQVFNQLTSFPSSPFIPGQDYWMEGTTIRWPNNVPRTFSAGPYARFVSPTFVIDGSHDPNLPVPFRMLILYRAAAKYAASGGQQDPGPYEQMYQAFWQSAVLPMLSTQFRNQGAVAALQRPRAYPFPLK